MNNSNFFKRLILILSFLISFQLSQEQTVVLNYINNGAISQTQCNVFRNDVNINNVIHSSHAGGVTFRSTSGLSLSTTPQTAGTALKLRYPFKNDFTYNISIVTSGGSGGIMLNTSVVRNFANFPSYDFQRCSPDPVVANYRPLGIGVFQTLVSASNKTNTISFKNQTGTTYDFLLIWASLGRSDLSLDAFNIRSITITETSPPPPCNLLVDYSSLQASNACGASGTYCSGVNFSWGAVSGAVEYRVSYEVFNILNGSIYGSGYDYSTTSTNVTYNASFSQNLGIRFKVRAKCSTGSWGNYSEWSQTFAF